MERRWFLFKKELARRCGLNKSNKSMGSLGPIENTGGIEDSNRKDTTKNIQSCGGRDDSSYSTQYSWNNCINSCINSYLRSEFQLFAGIDLDTCSASYIYRAICRENQNNGETEGSAGIRTYTQASGEGSSNDREGSSNDGEDYFNDRDAKDRELFRQELQAGMKPIFDSLNDSDEQDRESRRQELQAGMNAIFDTLNDLDAQDREFLRQSRELFRQDRDLIRQELEARMNAIKDSSNDIDAQDKHIDFTLTLEHILDAIQGILETVFDDTKDDFYDIDMEGLLNYSDMDAQYILILNDIIDIIDRWNNINDIDAEDSSNDREDSSNDGEDSLNDIDAEDSSNDGEESLNDIEDSSNDIDAEDSDFTLEDSLNDIDAEDSSNDREDSSNDIDAQASSNDREDSSNDGEESSNDGANSLNDIDAQASSNGGEGSSNDGEESSNDRNTGNTVGHPAWVVCKNCQEPNLRTFLKDNRNICYSCEKDVNEGDGIQNRPNDFGHLWVVCENCDELNYKRLLRKRLNICESCEWHLKMNSPDRLDLSIDPDTWGAMDEDMVSIDPIEFLELISNSGDKNENENENEYEYENECENEKENKNEYENEYENEKENKNENETENKNEIENENKNENEKENKNEYENEKENKNENETECENENKNEIENENETENKNETEYENENKYECEYKFYKDRLDAYQTKTGLPDAIQTGIGELNGIPIAVGVMDFEFIGGSMGSVVGEKITRLIEYATNQFLPLIIVCASGGARMQEGSVSLMQMAKISSALYDYQTNKKLFYISILASPTTGGVMASFGTLADIVIAEPNACIAFAGKRVIEQTLKIEVPEGVQETEFLFEKGSFDLVVPRKFLKTVLTELLNMHGFFPLTKNANQNQIEG
jgi:acetyl-CoA carboxylase carboxyl transferase subunit beta|uniref:Acetyl-coenzyme A carboxylase carboxyl transferase subunit beta, chloroplastic n=1 Tax=Asclepias tuberosa subsp. interior TaxID=528304 RepID=A0A2S1NJ27_ASCTU|nr:acetyl-CoA carboxylase carboxyltransferase beta subunit protein [Asclepias tuberosa subsp. interior]